MTWTGAFGRACRVLLHAIVRGLALTRISPNVLTFLGLVINTIAAILFGYANPPNYVRLFLYAGLVIIGAGIFRHGRWPRGASYRPGHDLWRIL